MEEGEEAVRPELVAVGAGGEVADLEGRFGTATPTRGTRVGVIATATGALRFSL